MFYAIFYRIDHKHKLCCISVYKWKKSRPVFISSEEKHYRYYAFDECVQKEMKVKEKEVSGNANNQRVICDKCHYQFLESV